MDREIYCDKRKREFNTHRTGLGHQYTNIAQVNKMPCQQREQPKYKLIDMHDCKKALNFFLQSFCRRREAMLAPHKVGSFSYSMDFGPNPLMQRTAPKVLQVNTLNSYPGNVLYPYPLLGQVGDKLRLQYVRPRLSIWDKSSHVICTDSSYPSIQNS